MRFTDLIRLPSQLLLLTLATTSPTLSSTTSDTNNTPPGSTFCLSTSPTLDASESSWPDQPLYLFNPTKKCSDQVVTFTTDLILAHNFCHAPYQSYQFSMCGKNVTMKVNGGPKSLIGVREMRCGVVMEIEGKMFQGIPMSERDADGKCYSKGCPHPKHGRKGKRAVYGVFEWEGVPLCGE